MKIRKQIEEVLKSQETIKIKYHGGSQPGTIREIQPRRISGKIVTAHCRLSNRIKSFNIDKIEILAEETKSNYNPHFVVERSTSLTECLNSKYQELSNLGWYVKISEDEASVHRYFKNGTPRKTAEVEIIFYKFNRLRPWSVKSTTMPSARTFTHVHSASELFCNEATKLAGLNFKNDKQRA